MPTSAALFVEKLSALRARMNRPRLAVPSSVGWTIDTTGQPTVVASMDAVALGRNLQHDAAAAPFFALCLAWWFEHFGLFGDQPVRARVEVPDGWAPGRGHPFRSAFVLHELALLLPERFTCTPSPQISWPGAPILNAAIADREAGARPQNGGEHAIEVAFTRQSHLPAQFAAIDAIEGFRRQLPLGLCDRTVSRDSRWSPGGASQIDLWAPSVDGRAIHLFELKDAGNCKVGILAEAFWYARLLHRVRTRSLNGCAVLGGGPDAERVRRADRIAMWLLVQDLHPLVLAEGHSPLAWLRDAMAGSGVSLGVLFYEVDPATGRITLQPSRAWV